MYHARNIFDLRFMEASFSDEQELGEFLVQVFVNAYAKKMPEVRVLERRKDELRHIVSNTQSNATTIVARYKEQIVGSLTLFKPGYDEVCEWIPFSSELRFMGVDEAWTGSGLSQLLMAKAEEQANTWNAASIYLHVRKGANGVARFYEALGFERYVEGDRDKLPEVYLEAYHKMMKANKINVEEALKTPLR